MKEKRTSAKSENIEQATADAHTTRRELIKKYGKLAAVTPFAAAVLMSPETSKAMCSGGNCGGGNGNGSANGNGNGNGNANGNTGGGLQENI